MSRDGEASDGRALLDKIEAARAAVLDEGRPEAVARQHDHGKYTARERITKICDDGSFQEVGSLVEPLRDTGFNKGLVAPADGLVTGTGLIDGRPVSVMSHDYTVLGGSTGSHGAAKGNRAITIATDNGMPLVGLLEGGGHRIQDGQDSRHFASANAVFQMFARNCGWVPQAMAMLGQGFAGPTNYASLADFVVMIKGQSTMGMAGPALVKAGLGEDISKEDLGGAQAQTSRNGISDLAVDNEDQALAAVKRFLSYLPSNAQQPLPINKINDPVDRSEEELLEIIPASPRKSYDVRRIIELIADKGSVFEKKPSYARNMVTSFARLNGRPVGFVANQAKYLAGMLDVKACEKASHFIALCDAFGLPLVMMIDVPGFAIGSEAEKAGLGRRSGRLMYEMGLATVPRVSIVLRKGYGGGYYAMGGGKAFDNNACFAWPTAEICAMSVEGSVDVAYRRDYEAAEDPAARRQEIIDIFKSQLGAQRAAEGFGIDEVIDPRQTRQYLINTFERCAPRRPSKHPPRVRPISPI
ncbi:MAG: acyl-CoA carboxylase [Rhodospirillaceae bacterium]|jgi:acetyl-CoA carboxylase carboxyltransferase component|nr:acyl-CoA carboxylase [Rhodospirillaceae bacterium]MBT5899040.1 acyl-CoA carboxylase [Rhodospirillaceae bacterium]MBT6430027.1 acyl-CoA carboxylase [Rhodospirillaceae bacterium]MBT7757181.1 acyl-CoA carboxylase [Rhodospirillaceae bacterium]